MQFCTRRGTYALTAQSSGSVATGRTLRRASTFPEEGRARTTRRRVRRPNPRAAEILRDSMVTHCERPLKALMRGSKRGEPAAIILALIVGLQLFRGVIGNKACS